MIESDSFKRLIALQVLKESFSAHFAQYFVKEKRSYARFNFQNELISRDEGGIVICSSFT